MATTAGSHAGFVGLSDEDDDTLFEGRGAAPDGEVPLLSDEDYVLSNSVVERVLSSFKLFSLFQDFFLKK